MGTLINLSDRWRINKSLSEHIELANTLKALRKITKYLDLDVDVAWSGMMPSERHDLIELPPSLVIGEYPIPADKMDVLIGLCVHESFHILENSRYVRDYHFRKHNDEIERELVLNLVEICEDIHIDGVARKRGIIGKYVQKFRTWWVANKPSDIPKVYPTLAGLMETYLNIVLDLVYPNTAPESLKDLDRISGSKDIDAKKLAQIICGGNKDLIFGFHHYFIDMPQEYDEPLKILLSKTNDIVEKNQRDRSFLYDDFWTEWKEVFFRWKEEEEKRKAEEPEPFTYSQASFIPDEGLSPETVAGVNQALAYDEQDADWFMEYSLESVGGEYLKWALLPTIYEDSKIICKTKPNLRLARRLKDIFFQQQFEFKLMNRGLISGKLDRRRLYRVFTTETIFKQKEYNRKNIWDIVALVDSSSSMEKNWELVENIIATINEAWQGFEKNFRMSVYSYAEDDGSCIISNLLYGGKLFTSTPSGNTPSGQAVIATALLIPKVQDNRKVLLHLTDGRINSGVGMDYAIKFCEQEGIDLLTIGPGIDIVELNEKYGDKLFKPIDSLEDLPDILEDLFRNILLGKR